MFYITTSEEGEESVTMNFGLASGKITVVLRTPMGEEVYSAKYTPQGSIRPISNSPTDQNHYNPYFPKIHDEAPEHIFHDTSLRRSK